MGRMSAAEERRAWTRHIEGLEAAAAPVNKYGAEKTEVNGRVFASKREAKRAKDLQWLEHLGKITELRYQVTFELVPGMGKVRPITYVCDFQYRDEDGKLVVEDSKGYTKVAVYRLKKKLMFLLLGIEIKEV